MLGSFLYKNEKKERFIIAKRTNKFSVKGELSISEGIVYESKKVGKEEMIVEVDFFGFLKEFDGKTVSISITEDREVDNVDEEEEEEDEE